MPGRERYQRSILINQSTSEALEFLLNPSQVTTAIRVNWNKQASIAATFERVHYASTANVAVSFALVVNRMLIAKRRRDATGRLPRSKFGEVRDEFDRHRNFLMSLCYPRGRRNDVVKRSPPRALLLWPRFMAIEVLCFGVSFRDEMFDRQGEPVQFSADLQLEEIRDFRLTSADVRKQGLRRPRGVLAANIVTNTGGRLGAKA